jgi:alkanesulfonate monooxygenase SsuD/methylene tetrahydromethanopterin reductase-like flavin-dependent oxidoreductase (luciferase family)
VICSLGAGWFEGEYTAYDVPFIADHDARIAHEREVALLLKELWTHPAPDRTSFNGQYIKTHDLPFNPRPYQQPHPPIWIGGNSPTTQALVKELADGWVLLSAGDMRAVLDEAHAASDWPTRPLEIVGGLNLQADETLESCQQRVGELAEWGVTYVRMTFASATQQAAFANALLRPEPAAPSPSGR